MIAHAATLGGTLHWQWGAVFCSLLVISMGTTPEVVVFLTKGLPAQWPPARRVAAVTVPSLHLSTSLADPSLDGVDSCCATVYEPLAFARLLTSHSLLAAILLERLSLSQRFCQALEHVRWHEQCGQVCSLQNVLGEWEQRIQSIQASVPSHTLLMTTLALQLVADPFDAAVLLGALPLRERVAAAHEHAHWLSAHGQSRTTEEVLSDWQALAAYSQRRERQGE